LRTQGSAKQVSPLRRFAQSARLAPACHQDWQALSCSCVLYRVLTPAPRRIPIGLGSAPWLPLTVTGRALGVYGTSNLARSKSNQASSHELPLYFRVLPSITAAESRRVLEHYARRLRSQTPNNTTSFPEVCRPYSVSRTGQRLVA
jgi:hypothetical protein